MLPIAAWAPFFCTPHCRRSPQLCLGRDLLRFYAWPEADLLRLRTFLAIDEFRKTHSTQRLEDFYMISTYFLHYIRSTYCQDPPWDSAISPR
jgi:hypothetical protein